MGAEVKSSALATVQASEQCWRALAEHAGCVILTADPAGTIHLVNRSIPPERS